MAAVATAATLAAGLSFPVLASSVLASSVLASSGLASSGLPSLGKDAVADAADGLDADARAGQLGAQPGQVDVDGVGAERVGLVVPDVLGDGAAVGHPGRAPHEDLQD